MVLAATAASSGIVALLSADLVEASTPANMCCGFYSCINASAVYFWNRDRAVAIFSELRNVAIHIEKSTSPKIEVKKLRILMWIEMRVLVAFFLYRTGIGFCSKTLPNS